jgi:hypothetical protein
MMDEVDRLNDTEPQPQRRAVRSAAFEVRLGPQPADFPVTEFRDGLTAALREDTDLAALGVGREGAEAHARVLSLAVDGPIAGTPEIIYRVRVEIGPGPLDRARLHALIADNVRAELSIL